jgi:hypothetical protein
MTGAGLILAVAWAQPLKRADDGGVEAQDAVASSNCHFHLMNLCLDRCTTSKRAGMRGTLEVTI